MTVKEKISKNDLRKIALNKREFLAKSNVLEKISSLIIKKIILSSDFKNAKNIALYSPIKNEIDITKIICKDKNFYFPKCINNELIFIKTNSVNELKKGSYNILEPNGEAINPEILDIIYIPALLANRNNYRLGYGKGFYDRFFSKNHTRAKKIIVISKHLINNDFIQDEYDIQCDEILSE